MSIVINIFLILNIYYFIFCSNRGRPAHLSDDISPEAPGEDSEHYDELSVVVQLSPRVLDGTRCRSGSLDMCIQGKCQVSFK